VLSGAIECGRGDDVLWNQEDQAKDQRVNEGRGDDAIEEAPAASAATLNTWLLCLTPTVALAVPAKLTQAFERNLSEQPNMRSAAMGAARAHQPPVRFP
jgi:hypothetical protein